MSDEADQDQKYCDSCGGIIKPGEVYAENGADITCEHCLEAGIEPVIH